MCIRREYVCIPNPWDLVYMYKFLQKYLLDPKDLLLNDALAFLRRNPVWDIVPNLIKSSLMDKIKDQSVSTYILNSLSALLEMSASCRGFFPPKTTDMPTCRRNVADTT
jgi:hypothetical protein